METEMIIPAAVDAIKLQELEKVPSKTVFISARLLARQFLGQDNEGLLCLSEYANFLRYLRLTTSLSLLADGQSGFGNALNTYYTAGELARSGADQMILNDQTFPAHSRQAQPPVSILDFVGKLKAAQDGLKTSSTELIVKLDGIQYYGIAGIEERLKIAAKLEAQAVVIGHLSPNLFLKLQNKISLKNIGLAQDNSLIPKTELAQAQPAFVIATNEAIENQKNEAMRFISYMEEKQNAKI
ncbi:methylisocitrate lyase [Liquorilactobacillus sucicola DSM 21376 = JCM 15457]|uniref:Carboxyvinyl-carboxyphosphonate phosphorylmutase n=1 Tax=Liquorilactobacillus sucicola DSM 21376 = JCM 15457 TaxID=1423806 RepID=A0A023CV73_9LACO|nr:isocitrate lyase/phosphoenolpyruvate mutase family protein [Liquorilactobacillus sucicola]KRN05598.1 carboxyvinyl-carboxyphosphonate phosphorylmutase [Liquorilactobacillus sucicola DSM 21376 = JCM 15457]GAJ25684.1 methylisocitrate lyase [Liquorilactobacillus sucicola DSM 21376 = JCM 15457]